MAFRICWTKRNARSVQNVEYRGRAKVRGSALPLLQVLSVLMYDRRVGPNKRYNGHACHCPAQLTICSDKCDARPLPSHTFAKLCGYAYMRSSVFPLMRFWRWLLAGAPPQRLSADPARYSVSNGARALLTVFGCVRFRLRTSRASGCRKRGDCVGNIAVGRSSCGR